MKDKIRIQIDTQPITLDKLLHESTSITHDGTIKMSKANDPRELDLDYFINIDDPVGLAIHMGLFKTSEEVDDSYLVDVSNLIELHIVKGKYDIELDSILKNNLEQLILTRMNDFYKLEQVGEEIKRSVAISSRFTNGSSHIETYTSSLNAMFEQYAK